MYSAPTYNFIFREECKFNTKRFCFSPKQRTFKHNAYTATYDLDNKLQTFGNKTITYDNDGNMTSGPIIEGGNNAALEFNARGQLMGTGDVAYAYDLENTRTIVMHYDKNKILTQYRYVYNRVGNVPEVLMRVKLTNMTSQSTYYVYGAGLAYEVKITPDGQEAVRYYHYDQVGSTVAMTDSAQAITDRFHYDPWGYVLHSIGDSDTPFQFVGAYGIQTDPNGLINMRARYYNPVTKSFISQDPSGFNGGLNWYLYANGNPFTYIDQNGETPAHIAIIAGSTIVGGLIGGIAALLDNEPNTSFTGGFWGGMMSGFVSSTAIVTCGVSLGVGISAGVAGSSMGSITTQVIDNGFQNINWNTVAREGTFGGISAGVMGKFVPTSSVVNSVSKTANKINSQGIDYFLDFGVKVSNKLTQNGVSASNLNSYFVNPYLNLGIGVEKVATNIGRYSNVYGSILSNGMGSGGSSLLSVGYSRLSWTK